MHHESTIILNELRQERLADDRRLGCHHYAKYDLTRRSHGDERCYCIGRFDGKSREFLQPFFEKKVCIRNPASTRQYSQLTDSFQALQLLAVNKNVIGFVIWGEFQKSAP